jgi:hypothetical protein
LRADSSSGDPDRLLVRALGGVLALSLLVYAERRR